MTATVTDIAADLPSNPVEQKIFARLLSRITVDPESNCWRSGHATRPDGYSQIAGPGRKVVYAHRVAYAAANGMTLEELSECGLTIDHVAARGCIHRNCVNPEHLELVTHRENVGRSTARSAHAIRTGRCKREHWLVGDNVRPHSNGGGVYCVTCQRAHSRRQNWRTHKGMDAPLSVALESVLTDPKFEDASHDALYGGEDFYPALAA